MRHLLVTLLLFIAVPAAAQSSSPGFAPRTVTLSGPRFGFTALGDGVVAALQERSIEVRPSISQFGWQFENQIAGLGTGITAMTEWVVLAGGLEQGVAIPSVSWLVGVRSRDGTEFGIGPNVTPAGVSLAMAAGITIRTGGLNVPINVAVVPGRSGTRVSFLTGFNFRRR